MINIYFITLDETTLPIYSFLRKLRNRNIKLWVNSVSDENKKLLSILGRDLNIIIHQSTPGDLNFYIWDKDKQTCEQHYEDIRHLPTQQQITKQEFICVDNIARINNEIIFFQDASHYVKHPLGFIKLPCFNQEQELITYLKNKGAFQFSIEDPTLFFRTGDNVQGKPVYKEISTGNYWYLDNFHKNHFEVFDSHGTHLGEADLNGVIARDKRDSRKHYKNN